MDVLKGCRVLILEEQSQIALVLAKMVEDLGCKVIGPANNVPDALRFIDENTVDAAILDVNIGGNDTLAIADELIERSIPFAFTSGNKTPASIERYAPARVITKPYSAENIQRVLHELIESAA